MGEGGSRKGRTAEDRGRGEVTLTQYAADRGFSLSKLMMLRKAAREEGRVDPKPVRTGRFYRAEDLDRQVGGG